MINWTTAKTVIALVLNCLRSSIDLMFSLSWLGDTTSSILSFHSLSSLTLSSLSLSSVISCFKSCISCLSAFIPAAKTSSSFRTSLEYSFHPFCDVESAMEEPHVYSNIYFATTDFDLKFTNVLPAYFSNGPCLPLNRISKWNRRKQKWHR